MTYWRFCSQCGTGHWRKEPPPASNPELRNTLCPFCLITAAKNKPRKPSVRDRLLNANARRTTPPVNFTSNVPAGTDVATTLPFKSKSSPGTIYECRIYTNGDTSCNCPAWRFVKNGVRSCKHTKEADMKKGPILFALGLSDAAPTSINVPAARPAHAPKGPKPIRRFDLDA